MNPTFRNILIFLLLVFAGIFYVHKCQPTPDISSKDYGNFSRISEEPFQKNIKEKISFGYKNFRITPLAEYEVVARVLSRHNYKKSKEAKLSTMDLVLGWGKMANLNITKDIKISQWGRWYYWKTKRFPIPRREIETHSANTHIIPATEEVYEILKKIKKHDIVHLKGKLVRVEDNNWYWQSSLSRKDTGDGSCELFWVEKAFIKGN